LGAVSFGATAAWGARQSTRRQWVAVQVGKRFCNCSLGDRVFLLAALLSCGELRIGNGFGLHAPSGPEGSETKAAQGDEFVMGRSTEQFRVSDHHFNLVVRADRI
jgi:hypothetical protein